MDVLRHGLALLADFYALGSGRSVLLAAHCLWCASRLHLPALHKDGHHRYLLSFWFTFLGTFGSGALSAFLFMRPDLHPVPAMKDPRLLPFLVAAWYFVQYTYIGHRIMSASPVRLLCRLSTTLSRAGRICNNSELAVALYPGVYGAQLVMGTVGGAGGKLACDTMKHCLGHLMDPAEVSLPGWSMRSGFLGSAVYLAFVHYLPEELRLEPQQAKALVVTVCMLHATLGHFLGADIDFTGPFGTAFHAITGIPTHSGSKAPLPSSTTPKRTAVTEERKKKESGAGAGNATNGKDGECFSEGGKKHNLRDRKSVV